MAPINAGDPNYLLTGMILQVGFQANTETEVFTEWLDPQKNTDTKHQMVFGCLG